MMGNILRIMLICLQPEDPLEQSLRFLKPLQMHAAHRIQTHIYAYEIYSRKGKILSFFLHTTCFKVNYLKNN